MSQKYDVVVVGAGITGCAVAYFLKAKGVERVLLVDRGTTPASSNTGRSAGIVRTFYTVPLLTRLAKAAIEQFETMEAEFGNDGGFHQTGFVQLVPPDWADAIEGIVERQKAAGIDTAFVDRAEWEQCFPWLETDGVHGILLEPRSGYADPVRTTEAYHDAYVRAGGEVRLGAPVRTLLRDGDTITGVQFDDGDVGAGAVVNAAGPWAKFLAASAGLDMPMEAVREQDSIWEVREGRPMPTTPVSNPLEAVYMRPMGGRRWLIGRAYPKPYVEVDPYNFKETGDNDFNLDLLDRMSRRIPPLQGARLIDSYAALYDVTPDWTPFFGPRAGIGGYFDASGGSGNSFKTGPILARELVDWILEDRVRDDFRQLSHDRIGQNNLFRQAFGGNRG